MNQIDAILSKYTIDEHRGFLPPVDPLDNLSESFFEWENIATNLSTRIKNGTIRNDIEQLKIIKEPSFNEDRELERAMLLLSCLSHAYLHCGPEPRTYLPEAIAIPYNIVAKTLKRKPVLSHASIVLNNWKRKDANRPIIAENLEAQCLFHGSLDETWFYVVTVEIEQVGAKAIPILLEAIQLAKEDNLDLCKTKLIEILPTLKALATSLKKMYEACRPHVFYQEVRPYLASYTNIEFKGVDIPAQSHHGASAAQSSLLQFFDAAFGMSYKNSKTANYLNQMRLHMPLKHAQFLSYIESISKLKLVRLRFKALNEIYQECINALIDFRNEHLKIVAIYIMQQAKKTGDIATGTGGTSPMHFLKSVRDQNIRGISK